MFVGHLQHNTSSFFLSTENVYSHFPGKPFRVTFWRKISYTQCLTNACFLEASKKKKVRLQNSFLPFLLNSQKVTGTRFKRSPAPSAGRAAYLYLRRPRLLPRGSSQSCRLKCCGQSYRETPAASRHRL